MEPENIDVVPSEENGNVPVDAPSEQPVVEAEVKPEAEAVEPTAPAEPELFDLPDGRKVDAATLSREFKENFLPEFTRKSQILADIEKSKTINQDKPYQNPDWQPSNWQEAIELAKKETLQELEGKEQARIEQQKALEDAVVSQITEIKKSDPTLNENALFLHANKYGFKDLQLAHQNMKDMSEAMKKVQTTTAQNIAKRKDPVSISPGATGTAPDRTQFGNAVEFFRSLK